MARQEQADLPSPGPRAAVQTSLAGERTGRGSGKRHQHVTQMLASFLSTSVSCQVLAIPAGMIKGFIELQKHRHLFPAVPSGCFPFIGSQQKASSVKTLVEQSASVCVCT